MKLIFAIVDHDDATQVAHNLAKHGYSCTKLASSGGFLLAGNVTLMIGVEDAEVQTVIDVVSEFSHSRKQPVPPVQESLSGTFTGAPLEVSVGGATIFVVPVDRFEKI